jgi:hypothetical protein
MAAAVEVRQEVAGAVEGLFLFSSALRRLRWFLLSWRATTHNDFFCYLIYTQSTRSPSGFLISSSDYTLYYVRIAIGVRSLALSLNSL